MNTPTREMTLEEEIKALKLDKTIEERIIEKYHAEKAKIFIDVRDYEKALRKQSELIDAYRKTLEDTIICKWNGGV